MIRSTDGVTDFDITSNMLAPGWRVGEDCALQVSSIDFSAGTAEVEATNIRIKGRGIVRQLVLKTEAASRVTPLPTASTELLRRRAGMSATDVATFLGHANPSITQDVHMNTLKGDARAGVVMQEQLKGLI